ncbi:exosortase/archaeosortase family protein [Tundrisphaera sp. TA3]|uniref:exosortase/archaeosortase family protein n=1 Tax=Tundrisphaera sp. TA3 TaxID=3435775 RepID=UPI003EB8FCAB
MTSPQYPFSPRRTAMATVPISTPRTTPPAPSAGTARDRPTPPLLDLLRGGWADPRHRALIVAAVGALGLIGFLFWENLEHFIRVWSNDENYSHGFLVPFISLYFANEAARKGPVAIRSGAFLGTALILLGLAMKAATIVIPFSVASDVGLLVTLAGVCTVLIGTSGLRRYGFAIFFLVFMIPLPVAMYAVIASPLQLLVSRVATSMLNLIAIPALCEGNMITLPGGHQLFVAQACSGMRQLTGFLALTTAWAYLSDRPFWNRLLLIGSSVPIAMTANVVRVTLTGVITHSLDPRYASGAFHTIEGLAMMVLGLAMLSSFSWGIDQVVALCRDAVRPGSTESTTSPVASL